MGRSITKLKSPKIPYAYQPFVLQYLCQSQKDSGNLNKEADLATFVVLPSELA
jgi:hypothetical protein